MGGFGPHAQLCWIFLLRSPSHCQMVSFGSHAQPCWICFILFSQPLLDGELQLARSAVLVFIYLVHSPSCPQMASSGSRTPMHLFFSYCCSSLPAVNRWRASAHTHSRVGSFFYFILRLRQPSIDGELQLAHKDTSIQFFYFILCLHQPPPAVNRQRASAHTHSRVGSFFYILCLRQLSIDGERLSFSSSHAQLHCFFFFYSSSTPAIYGWQASACVHSHVGFFFHSFFIFTSR